MMRLSKLTAACVALAIAPFAGASAQDTPLPPPGPFQEQNATPRAQQRLVGPDWNTRHNLPYWMQIAPAPQTALPHAAPQSQSRRTGAGDARGGFNGGFGFSAGISGRISGRSQGQAQGQNRYQNRTAGSGRSGYGRAGYGWGGPYNAPAGFGYFPAPWAQGYAPWQGYGAPAFSPYGYGPSQGYAPQPRAASRYGDRK